MFEAWIVWRHLRSKNRKFFNLVSSLAILGMTLGVASLITTMAVLSGFETTLHRAVVDITGHMLIIRRGEPLNNLDQLVPRLKALVPELESVAPFVQVEGMLANHSKITGVVINGFEPEAFDKTLNLKDRVVRGKFNLDAGTAERPAVLAGRALAEKMGFGVGDEITVVLPRNNPSAKGGLGFTPRLKKFLVTGILDLGMYEYDSRFLITSSRAAQELAGLGPIFTGARVKFTSPDIAPIANSRFASELGLGYYIKDWTEVSPNLFKAISIEKRVIFVVLLFMTLAACFNISSTLFVSVLRRYGDISIFRVLGASHAKLMRIFSLQGLVIGVLGSLGGIALGLILCFIVAHTDLVHIPPEVYHLRRLPVEIRLADLVATGIAAFLLCFISTLAPASRGAKLDPVEGLKYE